MDMFLNDKLFITVPQIKFHKLFMFTIKVLTRIHCIG